MFSERELYKIKRQKIPCPHCRTLLWYKGQKKEDDYLWSKWRCHHCKNEVDVPEVSSVNRHYERMVDQTIPTD